MPDQSMHIYLTPQLIMYKFHNRQKAPLAFKTFGLILHLHHIISASHTPLAETRREANQASDYFREILVIQKEM